MTNFEYKMEAEQTIKKLKDRIAVLEKEKKERALQRLSDFTQEADAEPVAWVDTVWIKRPDLAINIGIEKMFMRHGLGVNNYIPLYTTPQTKPYNQQKIKEILNGIDKEENTETGWWETSVGAKFGSKKLKELLDYLESPQTKPLSDKEIEEFSYAFELWQLNNPDKTLEGIKDFARAIEERHGIK